MASVHDLRLRIALSAISGQDRNLSRYPDGTWSGSSTACDPWGRQLLVFRSTRQAPSAYVSFGPNGLNDCGDGDDVLVTPEYLRKATRLARMPLTLAWLGGLLLWVGVVTLASVGSTARVGSCASAALHSLVPTICITNVLWLLDNEVMVLVPWLLPPQVSLFASIFLGIWFGVILLRNRATTPIRPAAAVDLPCASDDQRP